LFQWYLSAPSPSSVVDSHSCLSFPKPWSITISGWRPPLSCIGCVRSTSIVAPSKLVTVPEQMRTPPYEPSGLSVGQEAVKEGGSVAPSALPAGSVRPGNTSSNRTPRLILRANARLGGA